MKGHSNNKVIIIFSACHVEITTKTNETAKYISVMDRFGEIVNYPNNQLTFQLTPIDNRADLEYTATMWISYNSTIGYDNTLCCQIRKNTEINCEPHPIMMIYRKRI